MVIAYLIMVGAMWALSQEVINDAADEKSVATAKIVRMLCWAWPVVLVIGSMVLFWRTLKDVRKDLDYAWKVFKNE